MYWIQACIWVQKFFVCLLVQLYLASSSSYVWLKFVGAFSRNCHCKNRGCQASSLLMLNPLLTCFLSNSSCRVNVRCNAAANITEDYPPAPIDVVADVKSERVRTWSIYSQFSFPFPHIECHLHLECPCCVDLTIFLVLVGCSLGG